MEKAGPLIDGGVIWFGRIGTGILDPVTGPLDKMNGDGDDDDDDDCDDEVVGNALLETPIVCFKCLLFNSSKTLFRCEFYKFFW